MKNILTKKVKREWMAWKENTTVYGYGKTEKKAIANLEESEKFIGIITTKKIKSEIS